MSSIPSLACECDIALNLYCSALYALSKTCQMCRVSHGCVHQVSHELAIVTAHNLILIWNWSEDKCIEVISSEVNCILYPNYLVHIVYCYY